MQLSTLLSIIIAVLVAVICILLITRPKVVTLSDDYPKKCNGISMVMKLSNEIAPYVYRDGGQVKLKVVRNK